MAISASKPAPAKPAPAKATPVAKTPAPAKAKSPVAKTPAPAPKAPATPVPSAPTYRDNKDFTPALKAAKSLAKGNPDLVQPLQLITHLAWKTPQGSVGWAKGTTPQVIAYADDLAVPSGTPISEAMKAALSAASTAATDKPQKDAVAVLSKVIAG